MWDLIVLVPDHCLSLYFVTNEDNELRVIEYYPILYLNLLCYHRSVCELHMVLK